MKTKLILAAAVVGWICAATAVAADYDFYGPTQYPGAKLRPGVELYKVTQPGSSDAKAYERREVVWWPRKGVDVTEAKPGMPLRTWTWRARRPAGEPTQFEAHLYALRGMGNTMSSKYHGDGGPIEPGVVLLLPDGRKRCFPRGSFGEEDKKYIMDLYLKEMKRIKAGLDKTKRSKRSDADAQWPNNAKPGEPGTMQVECEHFIWLSGSQAGSDSDPWINEREPEKAQWFRDGSIECAEFWWALNEYAGNLMPYWDRKNMFKYQITVPGTKRDGYKVIPGYAGGGYGGCGIKGAGGGPWAGTLWHEWGHGSLPNSMGMGGGEAQADMHQCMADPSTIKGNHHLKTPWRNVFNASMGYGYTMFYSITGDDPNWGYAYFTCMPHGAEEWHMLQTVARVGQQRGLFNSGIRGLGDMFGEYAARLATFDCELEDLFRQRYFAPTRSWLETIDEKKGIYRIPFEESPEPYGANIVRLVADEVSDEIVVDFTGMHNPETYSDWRVCIVAVGDDGKSRYSPLWNKGKMTMKCKDGDLSYWLTVAATPTAIYTGKNGNRGSGEAFYTGRHAFRYPWSVQLSGCKPGTPRQSRSDLGDIAQFWGIKDPVPTPFDSIAGKRYQQKLTAVQKHLAQVEAKSADKPEIMARANELKGRVLAEMESMKKGARHANGGGWVADTAKVSPTACVGPNAMVLGNAQVLDHAIIDDYAVVAGNAVVSGHARVSGQAVVKGSAKVDGYSRTWLSLDRDAVATVVPKRPGDDELRKTSLWANYAMDRDDAAILEDWYRYKRGSDRRYGMLLSPVLNGYLYGQPEFVVDDDHRGFRFDGKTQYGELCPRAGDLGAITVEISVKWEGQAEQTIFDFGSSAGNCLVLKTAPGGKPELVATVDGKAVLALTSEKALPQDQWATLRVEIDGLKSTLWLDGKKVAEKSSTFRACDVFPGGGPKRNFLAASRDGSGYFKGIIDEVVVYHTVHEDFSKVPKPVRDAPMRPTAEYAKSLQEEYGNIEALNRKIGEMVAKRLKPFDELRQQKDTRERELKERDPAFLQAEADLVKAKEAVGKGRRKLEEEFNKRPETVKLRAEIEALRKKVNNLRGKVRTLERERLEADDQLKALRARGKEADENFRTAEKDTQTAFEKQAEVVEERAAIAKLRKKIEGLGTPAPELEKEARDRNDALGRRFHEFRGSYEKYANAEAGRREASSNIHDREKAIRHEMQASEPAARELKKLDKTLRGMADPLRVKRDMYLTKGAAGLERKVREAEAGVATATEKALAPYKPEAMWMFSFNWQGYGGYYNTPYRSYIGDHVRAEVGGGEMREDIGFLTGLQQTLSTDEGWSTTVDWDWRMRQEVDGSIKDMPLLRKWIKRVRGDVVTEKPTTTKQ